MRSIVFPGTFTDDAGSAPIEWHIEPHVDPRWLSPRFEFRTTIRDVEVYGSDLDGLEPVDAREAQCAGLRLNQAGELTDCDLTGEFPLTIDRDGAWESCPLGFRVVLKNAPIPAPEGFWDSPNIHVALVLGDKRFEASQWSFESALVNLERLLPDNVRLVCCLTCQYSDYNPYGGQGLIGMQCYRDVKDQYLGVAAPGRWVDKHVFAKVPVTEEVPEPYVCPEYERRVPGMGYRGWEEPDRA
jgi:Family of unknown function (DUF6304)